MYVNNLPRVIFEVGRLGLEPAAYWLQVDTLTTVPVATHHVSVLFTENACLTALHIYTTQQIHGCHSFVNLKFKNFSKTFHDHHLNFQKPTSPTLMETPNCDTMLQSLW